MRAYYFTLWLPILALFACKSTGNRTELAALKPVELSYAKLASKHIHASEEAFILELDHYLKTDDADGLELISALRDW